MARIRTPGLFWDDTPKLDVKREPPAPVWLAPDYLPGLDEARAFPVELFTPETLCDECARGVPLLVDCESYPNYFLAAFRSTETGRCIFFEESPGGSFDRNALAGIVQSFLTIGFNSKSYDMPMIDLAASGLSAEQLNMCSREIIEQGLNGSDVCHAYKAKRLRGNHIDLMPVAPLDGSLKIYAGRLHAPRMQDLPFPPGTVLSYEQALIVRWYCIGSDLPATWYVWDALRDQLKLRERMSAMYGVDLRSRSDAQIAEAVIVGQIERIRGKRPERPQIDAGTAYFYQPAPWLRFETDAMRHAFKIATTSQFVVGLSGAITLPPALAELKIAIGAGVYQLGIGGLHSTEKCAAHYSDDENVLIDRDVASYYPAVILNTQLAPPHLGQDFLNVYREIVAQRLAAKKAKDTTTADSLKITINGSFGKFGSPYSTLYAPSLLIQVTITGQLSLLMLIEWLELSGIPVVSANTDGIVIKCPRSKIATMDRVVKSWEAATNFETEATEYAAIYSRDVNNYLAVKPDGSTKGKGIMANPWGDPKTAIFRFHKNPACQICVIAATQWLAKRVPIAQTVEECRDMRQFVAIRRVKGGAVKDGVWLGKAVRFYYAKGVMGEIVYALSGNRVPDTDGAKPMLDLLPETPLDLDRARYIADAESLVLSLGVTL